MFVDYAGDRLSIVDHKTGEVQRVEFFVAILGASQLTYAEASPSQKSPEWIASTQRALSRVGLV